MRKRAKARGNPQGARLHFCPLPFSFRAGGYIFDFQSAMLFSRAATVGASTPESGAFAS
jgi:hypothetical protein